MSDQMFAYHFDLKRAMWTREYMAAMVDRLAEWGFNTIVYEVEDKFRFGNHPALAHADAWTGDETRDLAQACRAKGVEVIPLIQSLGHAESVVGKPEYAHLREAADITDQYDPTCDEARALLIEMFDEIIDATRPREFFHMGGDETWSLGKSAKCAPIVAEIGVGGLYLRHMLPLLEHVHGRGLRPIIWADIVLAHPEIIADVPKFVVMMDWDYWTAEERPAGIQLWGSGQKTWDEYRELDLPQFREHLERYAVDEQTPRDGTFRQFYCTDALREMGFDVITASANRSYGDMVGVPFNERHLPNGFYFARKGFAAGMGNLVTSWAVRHNHPETDMPGTFAAVVATQGESDFDAAGIYRRFTTEHYGVEMPEFGGAVEKAQVSFTAGQACFVERDRKALEAGDDPLPGRLAELEKEHGGRDGAVAFLERTAAGYGEARATFVELKDRAKRNARSFDFWIEGVDVNALYADFLLAALKGTLAVGAAELLARIEALRERTRALFSETYAARSVDAEVELRYGYHERHLRRLSA